MSSYFRSAGRISSRLKVVSLLFVVFGGLLTAISVPNQSRHPYLIWFGPALMGFSSCVLFSRRDNFYLRGVNDFVYLIDNNLFLPRMYKLSNLTVCACLGSDWHEITHVSERMIIHLWRLLRGKYLCLEKNAQLLRMDGQKSIYAVILGTRYGIPDEATLRRIWKFGETVVKDLPTLDAVSPGRDLRSVHSWPERFQVRNKSGGADNEE